MQRKSVNAKLSDFEFRDDQQVRIIHKNQALLSQSPGPGVVPQVIKGLWARAEQAIHKVDKRGLVAGLDTMWKDALRKHPQYFIKL